ncbi:MAG: ABC transporter permease, partial [Sneathiellales bacterium]|nr:ABC transporter permease [Sneathiellales bacterium]
AEKEILEKMKLLGTNNIIIKAIEKEDLLDKMVTEEDEDSEQAEKMISKKFSPGLRLSDIEGLKELIPGINYISPEVKIDVRANAISNSVNSTLIAITEDFFEISNNKLLSGKKFNSNHYNNANNVCIIGTSVRKKLFPSSNPIGKKIKCKNEWLTVIGVTTEKSLSKESISSLGIRDFNNDIYIPMKTMLLRFKNRNLISKKDPGSRRRRNQKSESYHQLNKITININDSKQLQETADIIQRMLLRKHNQLQDFEISVPELLLEQEQNTKRLFNIVLGLIASISLLVGGIGIMNIMLASVLERTKEIGIRMAIGAKKIDILIQFLGEAVSISLIGGISGVILGCLSSILIEKTTDIVTIISPISLIISFFVSISVGIGFGFAPAKRASDQRPIELLRYD